MRRFIRTHSFAPSKASSLERFGPESASAPIVAGDLAAMSKMINLRLIASHAVFRIVRTKLDTLSRRNANDRVPDLIALA